MMGSVGGELGRVEVLLNAMATLRRLRRLRNDHELGPCILSCRLADNLAATAAVATRGLIDTVAWL